MGNRDGLSLGLKFAPESLAQRGDGSENPGSPQLRCGGMAAGGESRAVRELGLFVPALPQKHIGVARPTGVAGDKHVAIAFRIDPASGALQPHDQPQALPSRPINISVDGAGEFLLTAYNNPSNVTVHRINSDGTIGDIVNQPVKPDAGIYAHQVRTTPSNQTSILVTRGNNPAGGKPEDPGTLKVFGFNKGVLTNPASIAPGNGLGFGPRHLDFHPTQPWVFVSIERQNKLHVYKSG